MREKVKPHSPHRGRNYSPSHRRSPDVRRNYRDLPPQRHSNRSSGYGEMERTRKGTGGTRETRERRDYGKDIARDRDRRMLDIPRDDENFRRRDKLEISCYNEDLGRKNMFEIYNDDVGRRDAVEISRYNDDVGRRDMVENSRYNDDLGRRDTDSMKYQSNYLMDHSGRLNLDSKGNHIYMDEDRDSQMWKMANIEEVMPQRSSRDAIYDRKHYLGERERITTNSSLSRNYALEYGGSSGAIKEINERNYQDRGYEGLNSSRMIVENPDINYPNKRNYSDVGGGDLQKNEKIRLHDDLSRDKLYEDGPQSFTRGGIPRFYSKDEKIPLSYKEEVNSGFYSREEKSRLYSREEKPYSYKERESQFYLNDSRHNDIPSSKYKAADPFVSNMNLRHSDQNSFSGYLAEPLPTENSNLSIDNARNYRKEKFSPNMERHTDYSYSTARRNDYMQMVPVSDKSYEKLSVAKDDYRHIDPLGSRIMDPITEKYSSHRENLTEERLWNDHRTPAEQLVSNYLDASTSSYAVGNNLESLRHKEIALGFEEEAYRSHENMSSINKYEFRRDEGLQTRDRRGNGYSRDEIREEKATSYTTKDYDYLYDRDRKFDEDYYKPLKGIEVKDVGIRTQSKNVLKRRRDISERLGLNRSISSRIRDNRPNKPLSRSSKYGYSLVSNRIIRPGKFNASSSGGGSVGRARVLSRGFRDIKKRLGPTRPVERDVVKPSIKNQKKRKINNKNEDGDGSGVQAEEKVSSEQGVETVKTEPPEKSEEFKQLVRSAFFKFIKQLNEKTAEFKKFKEQGKSGSLKCWVCGSDSEEFPDTESLIKHACTATRVGLRAQHLGFHKALCALMGWKAAEIHKDDWVHEALSVSEINFLKNDLILWPPLVVVHNSSIDKSNPDGQVAVSVEDLETMIKDMGFGEKTKVYRGKPVNQSIMVVKFSATYSGFQEAERLHRFFADQKHGRNEFLKKKSKTPVDNIDSEKASENNKQYVIYGFLGLGKDLNKLDSETKKRCVVRSKKEIQDLGDGPLKADKSEI